MKRRLSVALLALAAAGCAALSEAGPPQFDRRPSVAYRDPPPADKKTTEPCRVYIVPAPPEGAKRLGTIFVPVELAKDGRLDDQSRNYACGISATAAVKEEELVDKAKRPVWRMGLFRAP